MVVTWPRPSLAVHIRLTELGLAIIATDSNTVAAQTGTAGKGRLSKTLLTTTGQKHEL